MRNRKSPYPAQVFRVGGPIRRGPPIAASLIAQLPKLPDGQHVASQRGNSSYHAARESWVRITHPACAGLTTLVEKRNDVIDAPTWWTDRPSSAEKVIPRPSRQKKPITFFPIEKQTYYLTNWKQQEQTANHQHHQTKHQQKQPPPTPHQQQAAISKPIQVTRALNKQKAKGQELRAVKPLTNRWNKIMSKALFRNAAGARLFDSSSDY